MKKCTLFLAFFLVSIVGFSQETPIESDGAFVTKTSVYDNYQTQGLYTADGETLVCITYYDYASYISVAPGTKTISANAMREVFVKGNYARVFLPTSVRVVYPSSFLFTAVYTDYNVSFNRAASVNISDNISEVQTAVKDQKMEDDVEEVARYDIQGRKATPKQEGVQIIQYTDGSAKKILK